MSRQSLKGDHDPRHKHQIAPPDTHPDQHDRDGTGSYKSSAAGSVGNYIGQTWGTFNDTEVMAAKTLGVDPNLLMILLLGGAAYMYFNR